MLSRISLQASDEKIPSTSSKKIITFLNQNRLLFIRTTGGNQMNIIFRD